MPYPPLPEEKERKFHTIKFNMDNGGETQIVHWTLKRAGPPSDMISHAMSFVKAVESVALGAQHKAAQYRRTLAGTALTAFDSAYQQYVNTLRPRLANNNQAPDLTREPDCTRFSLTDCLKAFIAQRTTKKSRLNQIRGIQAHRKPRHQECHEWEDYFFPSIEAALWLQGNDPVPQGNTLKRIFLDSYPVKWVIDFKKIHGNDMDAIDRGAITSFMHERAVEATAADLRNQLRQKGQRKPTAHKSNFRRNGSKGSKFQSKNKKEGKPKGKDCEQQRISREDPCPFPGHEHKWGDCYNDVNNPEARKRHKERVSRKSEYSNMQQDASSDDESNHAQQEPLSDNEPGFVDGKKNGYRYPAYSTHESNHHLQHFQMQDLLLTPMQSATIRPGELGSSCMNDTPKSQALPGRAASAFEVDELQCHTAMSVSNLMDEVFDSESNLVNDVGCCSSNDVCPPLINLNNERTAPLGLANQAGG